MPVPCDHRARVFGVDFSGAVDAGKHIWITRGTVAFSDQRRTVLRIEDCRRADVMSGWAAERDLCLAALRDFIASQRDSIFGMDFPFGLPQSLLDDQRWEDFVRAFPVRYYSPEEFRSICLAKTRGREAKRLTDVETRTPFSALHMRIYRQTYYGIRDVLSPLISQSLVSVPPMQSATSNLPRLVEICPASTLKREKVYLHYKHPAPECLLARKAILTRIVETGPLVISPQLQTVALDDWRGDALDSIIAALAAFRALQNGFRTAENSAYPVEGYIYT